MKQTVKVVGLDGKAIKTEFKVRNIDHLAACLKYRSTIVEDKRKKDPKHKKKVYEID